MTTTPAAYPKAQVGRRILYTRYRDLPKTPSYPGVITGIDTDQPSAVLLIRLDGTRCNLHMRPNYEGLHYLNEIGPVPELPMGRFIPAESDSNGFYLKAGVLLAAIGEDGEALIVITDDLAKARAAAVAWAEETDLDVDYLGLDRFEAQWAVFEWMPEDAEYPWIFREDVSPDEDQAVHIYYLPAA
ncbi:hypothetical protein ACIQVL_48690 [Streptomyces sp. NPDC090499]|uniref:hypothetical protein n=1 Tax=Streptomyces sp. NPDC090499 TaxID=3365965 RepID=UPI0037F80D56